MNIPLVQPTDVPGPARQPFASPGAYSSGYAQAAQSADQLGQTVAHITNARRKQEILDSEAEAVHLQSKIEVQLQQQDFDLKRVETDPAAYLETRRKSFKDVSDQIGKEARQPYTQQILTQHLDKAFRAYDARALEHADGLRVKKGVAEMTTTIDNFDQALALTPYADTETIARLMAGKEVAIAARAPMIGADTAAKLSIAERKEALKEIARRHADADPANFLANLTRYHGMDGEKRDALVERATSKIEAAEKKHREEMEHFYKTVEADAERERQAQLTALDEKARARALTSMDLRDARMMRVIEKPSELDHLAALINAPPDRESDREINRIVGGDVLSLTPKYSAADIRRMMAEHAQGGRGLSQKDGFEYISRLRQNGERAQDKDHQFRGEQYQRAVDEGLKRLGIASTFETLDPVKDKLRADFIADMNARTDWTLPQGGRPSREVLNELLPRYVSAQRQETHLGYQAQAKTLDPSVLAAPVPADPMDPKFLEWYSATAKKVEELAVTNPGLYPTQRARLMNLLDARKKAVDQALRNQDLPRAGGGASSRTPVEVR